MPRWSFSRISDLFRLAPIVSANLCVDWPRTPVDRLQEFRPPFCPRRHCSEHLRTRPGYRYRKHASYRNARGRKIPRFLCLTCGETFSSKAFSATYYLKRPELLLPVAALLNAGAAHRQIARSVGCAPSTVTRLSAPRSLRTSARRSPSVDGSTRSSSVSTWRRSGATSSRGCPSGGATRRLQR